VIRTSLFPLRMREGLNGAYAPIPVVRHNSSRTVDPETIYNWRRLDDRIKTSGQPTEQQLADIRALGVRHIVNLGLNIHEKALPDEAASVASLGSGTAYHLATLPGTEHAQQCTRRPVRRTR
jgi:hypothetical protein